LVAYAAYSALSSMCNYSVGARGVELTDARPWEITANRKDALVTFDVESWASTGCRKLLGVKSADGHYYEIQAVEKADGRTDTRCLPMQRAYDNKGSAEPVYRQSLTWLAAAAGSSLPHLR